MKSQVGVEGSSKEGLANSLYLIGEPNKVIVDACEVIKAAVKALFMRSRWLAPKTEDYFEGSNLASDQLILRRLS